MSLLTNKQKLLVSKSQVSYKLFILNIFIIIEKIINWDSFKFGFIEVKNK